MKKTIRLILFALILSLLFAVAFACEPGDNSNVGNTSVESGALNESDGNGSASESEEDEDDPFDEIEQESIEITFEPSDDKYFTFTAENGACCAYLNEEYSDAERETGEASFPSHITVPSTHEGLPVTAFAIPGFRYVTTSVKSIAFPKSIENVFMLRMYLPNLTKIYLEDGNENLQLKQDCLIDKNGVLLAAGASATIPNDGSVNEIGEAAFFCCRGLNEVNISDGVKKIGELAFVGTNLKKLNIGKDVEEIDESAFVGDAKISSITVSPENKKFYSVNNCVINKDKKTLIIGCKNSKIPSDGSVTTIGKNAFYGRIGVVRFNLIEFIENDKCYGIPKIDEYEPVDFEIPEGVTTLDDAFAVCAIARLKLPKSLTKIERYAFYTLLTIEEVYYYGSVDSWNKLELIGSFPENSPLYYTEKFYINDEEVTEIVFPEGTTKISQSFAFCKSATKVVIPNTVTEIEEDAFYHMDNLKTIEFHGTKEEWSKIKKGSYTYGGNDLYPCDSENYEGIIFTEEPAVDEESLKIFKFVRVGNNSYYEISVCDDYNEETYPTEIVIPGYYKGFPVEINYESFKNCKKLTSVVIEDGVKVIGHSAFSGCENLKNVSIPNSVIYINNEAFIGCKSLASITISANVNVFRNLFDYCEKLEKVVFNGTIEQFNAILSLEGLRVERLFYNCPLVKEVKCSDGVIEVSNINDI